MCATQPGTGCGVQLVRRDTGAGGKGADALRVCACLGCRVRAPDSTTCPYAGLVPFFHP
jgi:hypothetical protein